MVLRKSGCFRADRNLRRARQFGDRNHRQPALGYHDQSRPGTDRLNRIGRHPLKRNDLNLQQQPILGIRVGMESRLRAGKDRSGELLDCEIGVRRSKCLGFACTSRAKSGNDEQAGQSITHGLENKDLLAPRPGIIINPQWVRVQQIGGL